MLRAPSVFPTVLRPLLHQRVPLSKHLNTLPRRTLCSTTPTHNSSSRSFLNSYRLAVGTSLTVVGLAVLPSRSEHEVLRCEGRDYAAFDKSSELQARRDLQKVESELDWRSMGLGASAGVVVGLFIKKGLKAVAFITGGVFILLSYFSSQAGSTSIITKYLPSKNSMRAMAPEKSAANRYWKNFVDFVTADVQGRATFVAGVGLGLRLG